MVDRTIYKQARKKGTQQKENWNRENPEGCFDLIASQVHAEKSGEAGDVTYETSGSKESARVDASAVEAKHEPVQNNDIARRLVETMIEHLFKILPPNAYPVEDEVTPRAKTFSFCPLAESCRQIF